MNYLLEILLKLSAVTDTEEADNNDLLTLARTRHHWTLILSIWGIFTHSAGARGACLLWAGLSRVKYVTNIGLNSDNILPRPPGHVGTGPECGMCDGGWDSDILSQLPHLSRITRGQWTNILRDHPDHQIFLSMNGTQHIRATLSVVTVRHDTNDMRHLAATFPNDTTSHSPIV